jgi:hypothetical protein
LPSTCLATSQECQQITWLLLLLSRLLLLLLGLLLGLERHLALGIQMLNVPCRRRITGVLSTCCLIMADNIFNPDNLHVPHGDAV